MGEAEADCVNCGDEKYSCATVHQDNVYTGVCVYWKFKPAMMVKFKASRIYIGVLASQDCGGDPVPAVWR